MRAPEFEAKDPAKDMTAWMLRAVVQAKKLLIVVVGFTVLLIGVAMLGLPGPAIIVAWCPWVWESFPLNLSGRPCC